MNVAIEDLSTVNFILVRHTGNNNNNSNNNGTSNSMPIPKVTGSRQSLVVYLPVPDYVYTMLPPSNGQSPLNRDQISFKVTPVINFTFHSFISLKNEFYALLGLLQYWNQ